VTDIVGKQVETVWMTTGVHWHKVGVKKGLSGVVTKIDKANCVEIRVDCGSEFDGIKFCPGLPGEHAGGKSWRFASEKKSTKNKPQSPPDISETAQIRI